MSMMLWATMALAVDVHVDASNSPYTSQVVGDDVFIWEDGEVHVLGQTAIRVSDNGVMHSRGIVSSDVDSPVNLGRNAEGFIHGGHIWSTATNQRYSGSLFGFGWDSSLTIYDGLFEVAGGEGVLDASRGHIVVYDGVFRGMNGYRPEHAIGIRESGEIHGGVFQALQAAELRGDVDVYGGTFIGGSGDDHADQGQALYVAGDTVRTFGGTFDAHEAIYVFGGDVEIYGGDFHGQPVTAYFRLGTATIYGGSFSTSDPQFPSVITRFPMAIHGGDFSGAGPLHLDCIGDDLDVTIHGTHLWTTGATATSGTDVSGTVYGYLEDGSPISWDYLLQTTFGCVSSIELVDTCVDLDGDGICAIRDNCETVANADQADVDWDGIGDACDDAQLSITGTCPGLVTIEVSGATPLEDVALASARTTGALVVPPGLECEGTSLGLSSDAVLRATLTADGTGAAQHTVQVHNPYACGRTVRAVDMQRCEVSNAANLP